MTLAAGGQHRRRVDQIDHPGRPPRWAQPHRSSTSPCETLAACLRRCVSAGRPASRPATWPTWRSAIPGAGIRSRCSAPGASRPRAAHVLRRPQGGRVAHGRAARCAGRGGCRGGAVACRRGPAGAASTAATTFVALGGTSLTRTGTRMADLLTRDDIDAARRLLPSLCGRDPAVLDADGLTRAALESVAENTSDAQVAPLLWAAVGGVPAVLVYRGANTLDAMIGHRSPRYARFGWAAARFDDVAESRRRPGDRCAGGGLRASGRRVACGRVARVAARRRPAPEPQRRRRRGVVRRCARRPARRARRNTRTSWRSGRRSGTGRRRRSPISRGRCGCRGPFSSSARCWRLAAVSAACRSGRRVSPRW